MPRVLVTGANGHLGRRLIQTLPPSVAIQAVVRSERAQRMLVQHIGVRAGLTITLADPGDPEALGSLAMGCDTAVHLIGMIKETRDNRYPDSHQRPARAFAEAATRGELKHVVYLSILGANAASRCRCLQARAAVEEILWRAPTPVTVIRVPMVLGEGDRASLALARRAQQRRVFLFHAASLEQPIYAGDVVQAVMAALNSAKPLNQVLELAGPESLPRAALVARAAAVVQRAPSIHSLPLALGVAITGVMARCRANPPATPDMLRVLDHNDAIDSSPAATALGVELTPLDIMLERCIRHRLPQATTR